MLNLLEVRTDQGDLLPLPFGDLTSGYSIQEIDGLDPVDATIVSSSYATMDGEQYHASRRDKRNIVIKMGYETAYTTRTVRQLRQQLYEFFLPKAIANLTFSFDDGDPVQISGYVESFASPLFTDQPIATISILCMDPDFEDTDSTILSGTTVTDATTMDIEYDGTVETGIDLTFTFAAAATAFSIVNTGADGLHEMDFAGTFNAGDSIEVITTAGSKGVYLTRAGTQVSYLYALSPYSDWIQLQPGSNAFRVTVAGTANPYEIVYTTKYGGL